MAATDLLQDVWGVVIGGSIGHAFCTGVAVLGGRIVAKKISVRTGKKGGSINSPTLMSCAQASSELYAVPVYVWGGWG